MKQYHDLLREILVNGEVQYEPRTQERILGIPGAQYDFDVGEGFPLVTTRQIFPRLAFEELFWKLRGERNVKSLSDRNVNYWNANAFQVHLRRSGLDSVFKKHSREWEAEFEKYNERLTKDPEFAEEAGDLGPIYGFQWRHWPRSEGGEVDQLENLLNGLRERPGSRYHILNSWNPGDLPDMAIGPCPFWHQFTVHGDKLDLHMVQRSCDVLLGVPYNDAQDSALLHMIAQEAELEPRRFIHTFINVHAYLGVPPRADFWMDSENVGKFQDMVDRVVKREDYLSVREWYLENAPQEDELNEGKDHIPTILTQLSKEPKKLPTIAIVDIPLFEAIQLSAKEVLTVKDYNYHKWDSKARMAV